MQCKGLGPCERLSNEAGQRQSLRMGRRGKDARAPLGRLPIITMWAARTRRATSCKLARGAPTSRT
eukprot:9473388-Pyramimonas_sp.AAC.1